MDLVYPAVLVIAAVIGWYSTFRLGIKYRRTQLVGRDRLILLAFVVVSVIISATATYFGVLSVRRIVGYPPFDWTPQVSLLLACVVFLVPPFLDRLTDYVARGPSH